MTIDLAVLVVRILTLIVISVGAYLSIEQLRIANENLQLLKKSHVDNHDWNRRIETQKAIVIKDIVRIIKMNEKFDVNKKNEAIRLQEILNIVEDDDETRVTLDETINRYEGFARGIFQGIYDDEVVKKAMYNSMVKNYKLFKNYIDYNREKYDRKTLWIQYENLMNKWKFEENQVKQRSKTG